MSICSTASGTVTPSLDTVFTNGYKLQTTTLKTQRNMVIDRKGKRNKLKTDFTFTGQFYTHNNITLYTHNLA